jgi:hypothetical protein
MHIENNFDKNIIDYRIKPIINYYISTTTFSKTRALIYSATSILSYNMILLSGTESYYNLYRIISGYKLILLGETTDLHFILFKHIFGQCPKAGSEFNRFPAIGATRYQG